MSKVVELEEYRTRKALLAMADKIEMMHSWDFMAWDYSKGELRPCYYDGENFVFLEDK